MPSASPTASSASTATACSATAPMLEDETDQHTELEAMHNTFRSQRLPALIRLGVIAPE